MDKTRTYVKISEYGTPVFLRGRLGPPCRCGWVAEFMCDFPVGEEKTCDCRLCENCAYEAADGIHYCPGHAKKWNEFVSSGGVNLQNIIPIRIADKPKQS